MSSNNSALDSNLSTGNSTNSNLSTGNSLNSNSSTGNSTNSSSSTGNSTNSSSSANPSLKDSSPRTMILAAMFLAIAMVLPFLTGQIPQIGRALCPMHLPVLLCGFFCGPWYGLAVGFLCPVFRFVLFGMPPIIPNGLAMSFELASYAFAAGMLYRIFPKKKIYVYAALICAMIFGRIVWGIVSTVLYGISGTEYGWQAFISGALLSVIPGIIIQIILVPVLVFALEKQGGKLWTKKPRCM